MEVGMIEEYGQHDGGCGLVPVADGEFFIYDISFPFRTRITNLVGQSGTSEWKIKIAVAGDRTRVARVTGGNTHHYTTTTV
ncbi:hypothetical protein J1N35_033007 [Gossypium stocksii]|uniref:Uncharacterized protein n=1 Tax=Gossypium stocksii TaxID=47602 RepID=A0A9D3UPC3_9ROSI|nr:hypothetical protein J1N35_033007 [Gossypium stocksii]